MLLVLLCSCCFIALEPHYMGPTSPKLHQIHVSHCSIVINSNLNLKIAYFFWDILIERCQKLEEVRIKPLDPFSVFIFNLVNEAALGP